MERRLEVLAVARFARPAGPGQFRLRASKRLRRLHARRELPAHSGGRTGGSDRSRIVLVHRVPRQRADRVGWEPDTPAHSEWCRRPLRGDADDCPVTDCPNRGSCPRIGQPELFRSAKWWHRRTARSWQSGRLAACGWPRVTFATLGIGVSRSWMLGQEHERQHRTGFPTVGSRWIRLSPEGGGSRGPFWPTHTPQPTRLRHTETL